MKTTKTSSFQGNLHLMPNWVYFKESSHQILRTLLYFIFWAVPLKVIQQTMSFVIKGSPGTVKTNNKTSHRHRAKPKVSTYFLSGRS